MFTPSPYMSDPSTITSPKLMPMRNCSRLSSPVAASCSATPSCQAVAQATATAQLLTGSFDAQVTAQATNLATGIAQVDPLVTGETLLQLDAARERDVLALEPGANPAGVVFSNAVEGVIGSR